MIKLPIGSTWFVVCPCNASVADLFRNPLISRDSMPQQCLPMCSTFRCKQTPCAALRQVSSPLFVSRSDVIRDECENNAGESARSTVHKFVEVSVGVWKGAPRNRYHPCAILKCVECSRVLCGKFKIPQVNVGLNPVCIDRLRNHHNPTVHNPPQDHCTGWHCFRLSDACNRLVAQESALAATAKWRISCDNNALGLAELYQCLLRQKRMELDLVHRRFDSCVSEQLFYVLLIVV
mmetsp:Transcript_31873/g.62748  ORF Transcript_31873/g.62748 Transcript_31873/m.62748 type:complete len:235 (-) Transcript_31873:495-1199(-)